MSKAADSPSAGNLSAGLAPAAGIKPRDVVLVGAGERARAWLTPLRGSTRLRLVATVTRGDEATAPEVPRYHSLDDAMASQPTAAFAVALPPRAALEGALQLAKAGRAGVIEAPLHDAGVDADPGPGADGIRVAHGWVTLAGRRALEAVMRRAGAGRLYVEVAGLPEENHCDLAEGLAHAVALVRALLPRATVSAARHAGGGLLQVEFAAPSTNGMWTAQLRVLTRGQRLAVRVEGAGEAVHWSWDNDRESIMRGGMPLIAPYTTPAAPVRALAQLLPDATRGDGLTEAIAALRLTRSCRQLLPAQLPLGGRPLRQSASIARRRPSDLLGRLGLRGELPAEGGSVPADLTLATPSEPFELWAYRAGVKPVAFLTVRPDDVERTLAFFGDAHYERHDRRVHVQAQDCWTDRRDAGEPRVELYIAQDPELARRAAHLQAEVDPTQAIREIGALTGYPPCCVDAFAQQDDRANNSRNRYQSEARTRAPDGSTRVPWPWELNNLHTMIVPFYPCSYRCARALTWARACLEEMGKVYPAFLEELRVWLARPVLYFDHDHQLVFDGRYVDGWVDYQGVALPRSGSSHFAGLAAAIGRGNRLRLDDRALVVERHGQAVLRLERTDPALGFVAPFGVEKA